MPNFPAALKSALKSFIHSISLKINLVLVTVIFLIMAGWMANFTMTERLRIDEGYRTILYRMNGRVAWRMIENGRMSREDVRDLVELEFDDPKISAVTIALEGRSSPVALVRTAEGGLEEYSDTAAFENLLPADRRVYEADISVRGRKAGRSAIVVSGNLIAHSFNAFLWRVVALTLALSLVVFVLVYVLMRRIVVRPLVRLQNVVKKFTEKDFSVRCSVDSEDEIGSLSRNFNIMADSIEVYRQEITRQLFVDALTGLPNRNRILLDIEEMGNPALALLNVDSFKEINDFYGNKFGDEVLKEIATRLQKHEGPCGYRLYRMNGDEYALLFGRGFSPQEAVTVIRVITGEVNDHPFLIQSNDVNIRVTCGVALAQDITHVNPGEGQWTRLATNADMALKQAKKKSRNIVMYDQSIEIPKEYESNIFWRKRLKEAIREHKIVPFFQPIINNRNGRIEKYESLVRLIDPFGNVIAPGHFLEVAKRAHLYSDITKAMVDKVFPVFHGTDYEFSINLTLYDILDEDVKNYIFQKLRENPDLSRRAVFEILESEGIENYREVMVFIEEAKALGCRIAIDDFGSGYSNFEHILRLDVDYIKIDSSLIKNLDNDSNAQIITRTIANFARKLGLKTISEFVHSREVYEKAASLGVDYSQGFYFGEPKEFIVKPRDHLVADPKFKPVEPEDDDADTKS